MGAGALPLAFRLKIRRLQQRGQFSRAVAVKPVQGAGHGHVEQARVQIAARVAIGADIRDEHRVKLQALGQWGGHHHHPAGIVGILRGEPLHRLPQRLSLIHI